MSRVTTTRVDRWEEMFDRDIESLIAGRTPVNTDLQPLRGFVETLRAMAREEPSDEFIELCASESAAAVAALRATVGSSHEARGAESRLFSLRPQLATIATSLALVLGMTGVSWAADRAVPGEWYYPIDRALETVGIGNGGEVERLLELQTVPPFGSDSESGPIQTGVSADVSPVQSGLDRAAAAVANAPSDGSASTDRRSGVVERLRYLNEASTVDGQTVSDLASGAGRPERAAPADRGGRPDDVGKPVEQPGNADGAQQDKPDRPDS